MNRQLRDADGIAAALWALAQIDLDRGDVDEAFPQIVEAFQIVQQLQRPDGIAIIGAALGQILMADGRDEAPQVLGAAIAAFDKLGDTTKADELRALLDDDGKNA